jgi:low temperature requirement protein LtrA
VEAATEAGRHVEPEQRVTPLELFFDLVFVFAITQVTGMLSENPTWEGLGRGLLVLSAIWWAWTAYSWLTNEIDTDEDAARLAMFAAMVAMLVVALATPEAFGADGVLFGCAYFCVRTLHILVYAYASPDVGVTAAVWRLAPTAIAAPALLIVAGALEGAAQAALWVGALAIDFSGPYLRGPRGWRVSPAHFTERHGLIVIIALGESIVAIGVGAAGLALDAGVVAAAALGLLIAAALWWAYFDVAAVLAARKLGKATGEARAALARDAYSYLHLPIIAGIVLFALGIKKTIAGAEEPLETIPAIALCGGVTLYLLGLVAVRLRNVGTLSRQRLVTAILCLASLPVALTAPSLVALATVAALCTALISYEAIRGRELRGRVRAAH